MGVTHRIGGLRVGTSILLALAAWAAAGAARAQAPAFLVREINATPSTSGAFGTDPNDPDSDADGLGDGDEVNDHGTGWLRLRRATRRAGGI